MAVPKSKNGRIEVDRMPAVKGFDRCGRSATAEATIGALSANLPGLRRSSEEKSQERARARQALSTDRRSGKPIKKGINAARNLTNCQLPAFIASHADTPQQTPRFCVRLRHLRSRGGEGRFAARASQRNGAALPAEAPAVRGRRRHRASSPQRAPADQVRLKRRSPEDIAQALDEVVALLKKNKAGLRAEQIREQLGMQAKEMPRVLKEGLTKKAFKSKGQKRATTYFAT